MKVELIQKPNNPKDLINRIARICYNKHKSEDYTKDITEDLFNRGHLSIFEHLHFTFYIEGISRVTSHQLVRHRLASYTQQSHRYSKAESYIKPSTIADKPGFNKLYTMYLNNAFDLYEAMIEAGIPKEDARYILPQAVTTNLVMTMNARSLINFLQLRLCSRAQGEIRKLANEIYKLVVEVYPELFRLIKSVCRLCWANITNTCKGHEPHG